MLKIFSAFIFFTITCFQLQAQSDIVTKTVSYFPYQRIAESDSAIVAMQGWNKVNWSTFTTMLDDDSLKLKAAYALSAFVNKASLSTDAKKQTAIYLSSQLKAARTFYARDMMMQYLGLLGDDAAVKALAGFLTDEIFVGNAARALASIHSPNAIAALKKALSKANPFAAKHIEAALANANFVLPSIALAQQAVKPIQNPVQHLLAVQNQMEIATNPIQKKRLLAEAAQIPGLCSFAFVSKYIADPEIGKYAALVVTKLALTDSLIRGEMPRNVLEQALPLIKGEDSAVLVKKLKAHLKSMPYDNGFVAVFNGKNLDGWKALVGNPISRLKMTESEIQKAQEAANTKMQNDWIVKDGLLVFTGHGDNLATNKQYADFEMYVDWKITDKGDAGIYLRGTPQVQIWDTSRREVGAQVGSGGLYNNQKNQSKPLLVADNKIGEWNTFHIIMIGEKVTVYLNGILVTDKVVLENYWNNKLPIFSKEQIELQAHGTYVAYRNIYLREINSNPISVLSDNEKQQGFRMLFDGTNMDEWVGNKTGYRLEEGVIVVHPELSSGNLYTKDEFADFEYRFEFQLTPGANNGIGIRAPLTGDAAYVGMEIQVLDSEAEMYKNLQPYQYHGSVYGVIPAKRGFLKPIGEWNTEEILVKGSMIKVILNGELIVDGDIKEASKNGTMDHKDHPGLNNISGHIGFLGHGDVVRFRHIRVKK